MHGIWNMFITVLTKAIHWSPILSQTHPVQILPLYFQISPLTHSVSDFKSRFSFTFYLLSYKNYTNVKVMRMQDNLPCKKITLDKPEGRRRSGRPNLRWIDEVTKDAEKLGVRNWRARERDRDDCRRVSE